MKRCPTCLREYPTGNTFCSYDGKKLAESTTINTDQFVGLELDHKYLINNKIAEGGMGNVYHATHLQLRSPVAIKILHPEMMSDQTAIERFRREAQAAMQIRHTNAIAVLDFGVTDQGHVYLVMELLQGRTLRQELKDLGNFSLGKANTIMQQVCAAVAIAHKRGIIHRDLKPDNIFLQHEDGDEVVKVLDFGIAKLKNSDHPAITGKGLVVGTPHYMSPEQCYGKEIDTRADIYSLGIILYEMLTGYPPFDASTPIAVAYKQASEAPPPLTDFCPNIPASVNEVVLWAMAKNPDARPQTISELSQALAVSLKDQPALKLASSTDLPKFQPEQLVKKEALIVVDELTALLAQSADAELDSMMASSTLNGLPKASADENGGTRSLVKPEQPQKSIWLPARQRESYSVTCEECGAVVGRSIVANSTIICPNCRLKIRETGKVRPYQP